MLKNYIFGLSLFVVASGNACIIDSDSTLLLDGEDAGETSFDYLDQAVVMGRELQITFNYSAWGDYLADGFALVLFDAMTEELAVGGSYSSLGYANRYLSDGLSGGIMGIGFDAHGNYSNPIEDRSGGPGRVANSVAIRGSESGGYQYVDGTDSLSGFLNDGRASSEEEASVRNVRVTITSDVLISVEWKDADSEEWTTLLDEVDGSEQIQLADEIRVGFTSSLGAGDHVKIDSLAVESSFQIPEPAVVSFVALAGGILLIGRRIFNN